MKRAKQVKRESGQVYYSENFKMKVVQDVERGILTQQMASQKYNIGGHSTVLKWCRKYGTKKENYIPRNSMSITKTVDSAYKKRIAELEKELSQSKLRSSYLECYLEELAEMGVPAAKKFVTGQLNGVKSSTRTKK